VTLLLQVPHELGADEAGAANYHDLHFIHKHLG